MRQSATNPIFGAVVGSSLLAFPTAPWSTQPAAVRWDAFKTAREPVLGRSANPVFFRRGPKKVVSEVFLPPGLGGLYAVICS